MDKTYKDIHIYHEGKEIYTYRAISSSISVRNDLIQFMTSDTGILIQIVMPVLKGISIKID